MFIYLVIPVSGGKGTKKYRILKKYLANSIPYCTFAMPKVP
jgi:hypothetical protein